MRISYVAAGLAAALVIGGSAAAQESPVRTTIAFSDPSRPGTLKVNALQGSIAVKGGPGKDVVVVTRARATVNQNVPPDAQGLRRITPPAGLSADEDNNVISITLGPFQARADLEIQVPVKTNLRLTTLNGRDLTVDGVEGDIEVNTMQGSITLTDVSGSVVAHATNGSVHAILKQVTPQKAMSFTSFNGAVDVTLPPAVKANIKVRSDAGEVFTDFDMQMQPATARAATSTSTSTAERSENGRVRVRTDRSVLGTLNGGGPEFELRTFNGNIYLRKGK